MSVLTAIQLRRRAAVDAFFLFFSQSSCPCHPVLFLHLIFLRLILLRRFACLVSVKRVTKSHSMKLLWMILCDLYFCTIPVCLIVCVSVCVCVCEDMPMMHVYFLQPNSVDKASLILCGSFFFFFVRRDFVFSFYLNVTARWSAKTNLCPSLRDSCERCIFLLSTFLIRTKDHCLSCSNKTECLYPSVVLT